MEYFVKKYQVWVEKPFNEGLLPDLPATIDEANKVWASLIEDWALLDEQQQQNERGNIYHTQLHFHKLMAELYGYSFTMVESKANPGLVPEIQVQFEPTNLATNEQGQPIHMQFGKLSQSMVEKLLKPFLLKPAMTEITRTSLGKLKGMLQGASECMNDFALDKACLEPVVAYFANNLLDEPTKIVFRMLKGSEQCSVNDLIEVIEKRMSIMVDPQDVEMREERPQQQIHQPVAHVSTIEPLEQNSSRFCYYCRGGHWLQTCESFKKLHWSSRAVNLLSMPICANCLRDSHITNNCPGGPCKPCKVKHNSLVCPESPMNKENN